jgi:hypothetical protein
MTDQFLSSIIEPLTYLLWLMVFNAALPLIAMMAGVFMGIFGAKK